MSRSLGAGAAWPSTAGADESRVSASENRETIAGLRCGGPERGCAPPTAVDTLAGPRSPGHLSDMTTTTDHSTPPDGQEPAPAPRSAPGPEAAPGLVAAGGPEPGDGRFVPRLRRFLAEGSARAVAFRLVRFRLRQAEEALRVLEGGRTAPPWDETRARQHLNQIVEHRAARLVEVRPAARADQPDPALGGHSALAALRPPPRAPRAPARAPHRPPQARRTGPRSTWTPGPASGSPRSTSARPSAPSTRATASSSSLKAAGERGRERSRSCSRPRVQKMLFDRALAEHPASPPARGLRRVHDLLLQRLARQPQPLRRRQALGHGLHRAALAAPRRASRASSPPTPTGAWSRSCATRAPGTSRRAATATSTPRSGRRARLRDGRDGDRAVDPLRRGHARRRTSGTASASTPCVFEDLLGEPEATMRALCATPGHRLRPDPRRARRFNGLPIKADSSFAVTGHGVALRAPRALPRASCSAEEIDYVEREALPLYERVVELAP